MIGSAQVKSDCWVIQGKLEDRYVKEMSLAALDLGLGVVMLDMPFFSTEIAYDPPPNALLYAATTTTAIAATDPRWKDSVWFNRERFRWSNAFVRWGKENFINDMPYFCTFETVPDNVYGFENVFSRPDEDLKEFSGEVTTITELWKWRDRLTALWLDGEEITLKPNTSIVLSMVKEIAREWRIWIVDGKPVECSRYRSFGTLDQVNEFPYKVEIFSMALLEEWNPAQVFCLDIGADEFGNMGIIEMNCFNSAGWYAADIKKVLNAINHREGKS